MVRSALADETLLPYIQNLAKPDTCTVGLILGQVSKYFRMTCCMLGYIRRFSNFYCIFQF